MVGARHFVLKYKVPGTCALCTKCLTPKNHAKITFAPLDVVLNTMLYCMRIAVEDNYNE